jgi:hypothetical protein
MCTKHPLFLQQNVFNFVMISVAQHQVEFSCKLHHPQLSILMRRICASDQQVSRMLVGGMEVVGIFVFATETAFKNSTAIFWQVVRAVATASPIHVDGNEVVERLLLHISSSPRRLSCRSCAVDSGFSSAGLRPCDWKLGKVLSNLHTFVCSHPIEFRYASQQVGPFFWALAKLFRFSSEVLCHQEIKSFDYHRRH